MSPQSQTSGVLGTTAHLQPNLEAIGLIPLGMIGLEVGMPTSQQRNGLFTKNVCPTATLL